MAKAKTTAKRLSSCGPTLPNRSNEENSHIRTRENAQMGNRSRELNTGLSQEQRVKHSIDEKARREKEDRRREAEALRQLLLIAASNRKKTIERVFYPVPDPPENTMEKEGR